MARPCLAKSTLLGVSQLLMTLSFALVDYATVKKRVRRLRLCTVVLTGLLEILNCCLDRLDLIRQRLKSAPLLEWTRVHVASYLVHLRWLLTKELVVRVCVH